MTFGAGNLGAGAQGAAVVEWRVQDYRAAKAMRRGVGKHECMGVQYGVVINFVCWAFEQQHFPTPEAIVARYHCSRATAYRLRRALADAYGIEPPKKDRYSGVYVEQAA